MLPWRTGDPDAHPAVVVPPARMPLSMGRRPLKRWRYVGFYGPEVMGCAAVARVGPARLAWWAVWDRTSRTLAEASYRRTGPVRLSPGRLQLDDGPVAIDLRFEEARGVETISAHGEQHIWTRKTPVRLTGAVTLAERRHVIDCAGLIDDSAGYHARATRWFWSAGVGVCEAGAQVAWNLVTGVHDDPRASECTVWVDGEPHHVAPLPFAGLDAVGDLRFSAEATRARRENLLLMRSEYVQPFGTFSGSLPVAGRLREGYGVMEFHDVRW
jgi:hypothetical protein